MNKIPIHQTLWFKLAIGALFLSLAVGGLLWYCASNPYQPTIKIFQPKFSEIGSDYVELSGYYRLPEGKWGIPGFCIWEKGFEDRDPEYVWVDNAGRSAAIQAKPGHFKARKEFSASCYSTEFIARAFVLRDGIRCFSENFISFRTKALK